MARDRNEEEKMIQNIKNKIKKHKIKDKSNEINVLQN